MTTQHGYAAVDPGVAGLDGGRVKLTSDPARRPGLAHRRPAALRGRRGLGRRRARSGTRMVAKVPRSSSNPPRPGRRRGGRIRARPRAAAQHQGRRPQHRRHGDRRRRPDARHVADARSRSRPEGEARARRPRVPAQGRRSRDAGARARDRARLRVRDRRRRTDARRRFRLPGAPVRVGGRQSRGGRDRHRGRRDPRREPRRATRPLLGGAGRRRQLRRRHPIHVPPARGRPDGHGGLVAWPSSGRTRFSPPTGAHGRRRRESWRSRWCCSGSADAVRAQEFHGRKSCTWSSVTAATRAADEALAPIRALGDPVVDSCKRGRTAQQQSFLDDREPNGAHQYWKTENLAELSDRAARGCARRLRRVLDPGCSGRLPASRGRAQRARGGRRRGRQPGCAASSAASTASGHPDEPNADSYRRGFVTAGTRIRPFSTGGNVHQLPDSPRKVPSASSRATARTSTGSPQVKVEVRPGQPVPRQPQHLAGCLSSKQPGPRCVASSYRRAHL